MQYVILTPLGVSGIMEWSLNADPKYLATDLNHWMIRGSLFWHSTKCLWFW
jgi:hypothetical protein